MKKTMNITKASKVAAILTIALSSAAAFSQDKQTLDLLVSKGIITKQEAEHVSKKSVEVSAKEKTTKSIKLIGRVQAQYENIAVDEYDSGVDTSLSTKNDFIMRRIFLGMTASLGSGWSATVIADFFRSSDNYLEYAYITKEIDSDILKGTADIGYKKTKFALEEYTSASKLMTIERSIATRYFSESTNGRRLGLAGRHTGVYWSGKIDDISGFEYGASITNSFNNSPASIPTNADNSFMYCLNASYKIPVEEVAMKLGVNLAYTDGMNLASSTSAQQASAVYGLNPYITMSAYGFDVWADFLMVKLNSGKDSYTKAAMPFGLNVGIEYKFDIGEFGKIAPTLRYSWIDTDGRGIKMSDGVRNANAQTTYNAGQSIYAGLNWYIIGNDLKFQIGYEFVQMNGATQAQVLARHSDANVVRAQMQVLF